LIGKTKHIGKLGSLLGDYEEEREAERVRTMRRERTREMERESDLIPEEDDDTDEEPEDATGVEEEEESEAEARLAFERLIKERFIYGLLEVSICLVGQNRATFFLDVLLVQSDIYNKIDWDDGLDGEDDREAEEKWFDEEEEDDTPVMDL
jgi:hypothetical protein